MGWRKDLETSPLLRQMVVCVQQLSGLHTWSAGWVEKAHSSQHFCGVCVCVCVCVCVFDGPLGYIKTYLIKKLKIRRSRCGSAG